FAHDRIRCQGRGCRGQARPCRLSQASGRNHRQANRMAVGSGGRNRQDRKRTGPLAHSLHWQATPRRDVRSQTRGNIHASRRRARPAQLPIAGGKCPPRAAGAGGAARLAFATPVLLGLVAAATPSNGPANLLIQKVAPALAVGNAIVVKPSPPGTEVALLLAQAVKKAGVPDGLFNVVPGGRETAKLLAAHPLVAAVTVTGSTA